MSARYNRFPVHSSNYPVSVFFFYTRFFSLSKNNMFFLLFFFSPYPSLNTPCLFSQPVNTSSFQSVITTACSQRSCSTIRTMVSSQYDTTEPYADSQYNVLCTVLYCRYLYHGYPNTNERHVSCIMST